MTTWHWVRHGPTHEKTFVGWRDVPADLSDTAQIARLNAHLPKTALLVSSDLIRASATADSLLENRTRLPHSSDIREFNFGLWDGLGFEAVAQRDPDLSRAFWETPGDLAPPEGESWNAVAARVSEFVARMNALYPTHDIIAVAHIGVIMTQIQQAGNLSAYGALGHKIDNLSVTRLHFEENIWSTHKINHIP